jgi:hypothetical protein
MGGWLGRNKWIKKLMVMIMMVIIMDGQTNGEMDKNKLN